MSKALGTISYLSDDEVFIVAAADENLVVGQA